MRILLVLFIVCFFVGCGSQSNDRDILPTNAEHVIDIGNGWVTFSLDGREFLFHNGFMGYAGYEAITCID